MSKIFTLSVAALLVVALLVFALGCQTQDLEIESKKLVIEQKELVIPGSWKELPAWAAEDLPFDAEQYYGVSDEENREQNYLKSYLQFSFAESASLIPGHKALEKEIASKASQVKPNESAFDEFYDTFSENPPRQRDVAMRKEARKVLVPFEQGFELIEQAQSKPACFFHSAISTSTFSPHVSVARDVVRKLCVRASLNPGSPESRFA